MLRFFLGLGFLSYGAYSDLKSRMVKDRVWVLMAVAAIIIMEIEFAVQGAHWIYYLSAIPLFTLYSIIFTRGFLYYLLILDIEDDPKRLEEFEKWVNGPNYEKKENNKNKGSSDKDSEEETPQEKRFFNLNYLASAILGLISIIIVLYQISELGFSNLYMQILTSMLMMLLGAVFYQFGLFRGGADAKAFITLSIFCYSYPSLGAFPFIQTGELEQMLFPFVLVILFNSVVLYLFMPIVFLIRNLKNGDFGAPAFIGYKMDVDKISMKSYVWLVEKIIDGKEKRFYFGAKDNYDSDEDEEKALIRDIELLKNAGKKRVWVTPQTPFIVPLTVGFVLSFIIGNIMFSFLYWLIVG